MPFGINACRLFSLVKHCPANLFAAALRARGHQCVLEETREWNMVELVVSGELVFRCHVKQLEFGEFGKRAYVLCYSDCVMSRYDNPGFFCLKVETGNWILFVNKLSLLWRTLTEDKTTRQNIK